MTEYFLGNATEHYQCHKVWTFDTRSVQIGHTVFFKHKYLTQPSIIESDTLLRASAKLCAVLKDTGTPVKGDTRRTVSMLMDIFKNVAKTTAAVEDKHKESRSNAATTHTTNEESEPMSNWIPYKELEINKTEIWNDDIRLSASMTIKHGGTTTKRSDNNTQIVEDDQPPVKTTRSTR